MRFPEPELFRSGRQFAAWIGLTPKDHSTAGKVRLGVITRAGDEGLRSVLVVGATAVIQHVRRGGRSSPWLTELLKRKSPKLAAVALANKMARIAWKLMVTGENYAAKFAPARYPLRVIIEPSAEASQRQIICCYVLVEASQLLRYLDPSRDRTNWARFCLALKFGSCWPA